ncbi:hypothetical protein V6N13_094661 [Hibiscus sabdariffa]
MISVLRKEVPEWFAKSRATEQHYWKGTGEERNVKSGSDVIGTKRTLVFHTGRAPKAKGPSRSSMNGKSQDSPVVYRLRKNSEFRLNDNSIWGPPNHRELLIMHDSNHATATSDAGTDLTGLSEGNKAVKFYSKKATICNDSHSIVQIDSACES